MGFVRSVDDLVPAKGGRLTETFSADFTNKRPSSSVHGHVSRQIVVSVKHLSAFGTGEGLLFVGSIVR